MPDFNAIWQQYQPILQQYRDDISKRSQDLTNMQASGNTFEDRLKQRLKSIKSIQEPAIQAKKAALEGAMNAPQQGRELFSNIKNPLAREQATQPLVSRAVADYGEASDRLKQVQTPAPELIQSATNARAAEQARIEGMLTAAQDRYTMLRDEFETGYQMAQDEWDRSMETEQLNLQKQAASRSGGGGGAEEPKIEDLDVVLTPGELQQLYELGWDVQPGDTMRMVQERAAQPKTRDMSTFGAGAAMKSGFSGGVAGGGWAGGGGGRW